jgi:periplasmic divalent cation tolerance protein
MTETIAILTNVPDPECADRISRALVERRLAACVNILPGIRSVYQWEGKVEETQEITLLIKTAVLRYQEIERVILDMHPYQVPEIIALPITAGLPAYLGWIASETRKHVQV